MHLPFSSGSILSSVDIQAPDLRAITDQMEDRSKKIPSIQLTPHMINQTPFTCQKKKLLTRKSLYLTKKVLQLQWE